MRRFSITLFARVFSVGFGFSEVEARSPGFDSKGLARLAKLNFLRLQAANNLGDADGSRPLFE